MTTANPIDALIHELNATFDSGSIQRITDFLEVLAGRRQPNPEPGQQFDVPLFIPGLTNAPWYDGASVAWLDRVNGAYPVIRKELEALSQQNVRLEPYGPAYAKDGNEAKPGVLPVEGWNAFYFFRAGKRVEENCQLCPETARILESIPAAQDGMFSVLEPGTEIPEHSDGINFLPTAHLGILVPDGCEIRVGAEKRAWKEGETLLINTSFLHQAWNRSSERRVVLLFDFWHFELTPIEVQALESLRPKLESLLGLRAIDERWSDDYGT